MNKLNQTEHATFSVLPFWTYFSDSHFLYFIVKHFIDAQESICYAALPVTIAFALARN
jgi:hypothetical protein